MSIKCQFVKTLIQGVYIHLNNYLYFHNLVKIEAKPTKIREASKITYILGAEAAMPPAVLAHAQYKT